MVLAALAVGLHHAVDELLEAPLTDVGAEGATEVLRGHDRRGVDRPEVGELHAALLEDGLAGLPVLLDDVAALPVQLVVGVYPLSAEHAVDLDALRGSLSGCSRGAAHRLRHACLLIALHSLSMVFGLKDWFARRAASPPRAGQSVVSPRVGRAEAAVFGRVRRPRPRVPPGESRSPLRRPRHSRRLCRRSRTGGRPPRRALGADPGSRGPPRWRALRPSLRREAQPRPSGPGGTGRRRRPAG